MKSCRLMSCYYFYAVVWVTMNARFWCRAASFSSSETCTLTCKQHLHGGFVALWLTLQRFVVHEKVKRVYLRGNNRLLLSTMWGPVCVVVPLSFVTRWRLNLATAVVCVCVWCDEGYLLGSRVWVRSVDAAFLHETVGFGGSKRL